VENIPALRKGKQMTYKQLYTDYPVSDFGDIPNQKAPVRKCRPLKVGKGKYITLVVYDNKDERKTCTATIKRGYVYSKEGRLGEVPPATNDELVASLQYHKSPRAYPK